MDLYAYNCRKQICFPLFMISLLLNAENYACFTLHYGPTHACSDVNGDVIAVEDNAESLY